MPVYTRLFRPGGTFFLTLVTEARAPIFADQPARDLLHSAIERCRQLHPFTLDAFVCLPDHLHLLITMPEGDADFSIRIRIIKSNFTHAFLGAGGLEQPRSQSRQRQRSRGVWLKRFWEHTICDTDDLLRHFDYIHYNPVKHKHAACPHEWEQSSFRQFVAQGQYAEDWLCQCGQPLDKPPMDDVGHDAGE